MSMPFGLDDAHCERVAAFIRERGATTGGHTVHADPSAAWQRWAEPAELVEPLGGVLLDARALKPQAGRGRLDMLISHAADLVRGPIEEDAQMLEIATILAGTFALRLLGHFDGSVAVAPHPALAELPEALPAYARRLASLDSRIQILLPDTEAGTAAASELGAAAYTERCDDHAAELSAQNFIDQRIKEFIGD
ncbi:MAG: hypothetical protein PF961_12545 [Planctomycetota bacterium]|jgi:hypothetical protein|nr:hypothetical protein [Planctomycetota bacterium]